MMETPKITVIVPVYKVEAFLDRCVESVRSQTYTNLEILLVDDGSPDSSGAMCDVWAQRDDRICVIHKANGGLSSARNAGLDVATGEYVMFIDSDDVIHPDMCQILLTCAEETKAQLVACDVAHTFEGEEPPYHISYERKLLSPREAIASLWYQKEMFPSACTKLYARYLFDKERFAEGLLFEDVDIMHRLFWQTERVVYIPCALYGYMHRGESITTQSFSVGDLDILTIAERIVAFAKEQEPSLLGAAHAYAVTAAMRVELNAPMTEAFAQGRKKARVLLKQYGMGVILDSNTRRKTRLGTMLYFGCRPLMRYCYKRVDRWK